MDIDSATHLIKSPSTSRFRFNSGDTVPAGFTIATDLLRSATTTMMRSFSSMYVVAEVELKEMSHSEMNYSKMLSKDHLISGCLKQFYVNISKHYISRDSESLRVSLLYNIYLL